MWKVGVASHHSEWPFCCWAELSGRGTAPERGAGLSAGGGAGLGEQAPPPFNKPRLPEGAWPMSAR